jgi:hypothetical protein
MHGYSCAVEQRALVVAHLRWEQVEILGRRQAELGEASRPRDSDVLERAAVRVMTSPASLARSTRDHRLDADAVAGRHSLDSSAHRNNGAGKLVTLSRARIRRRIELRTGSVLVQVASADAGCAHPHDGLAGAGHWVRELLEPEVPRTVERRCEHGGALYRALRWVSMSA